jgi:hypothetical protein
MAFQEYRIKTDVGGDEKVIHVNLKQEVDVLKILSLELNSEDTYQLHTSGYGVIVGRVLGNGAYGIPNVRVSVFIPLESEDGGDTVISSEYPYATLQTKDSEGKKYNLLPNATYGGYDGKHKPIGTFPNKRQILDNNGQIEVFDKYWKYTTVTNEVGDYMLFGVPTGVTQVHIDCDISDIGLLSQRPYDLVAKGYDENLFDSMTEFKTDNLESAPQIMSQNKTVTVFPFWGDKDINRIGITRCDIDLDYDFTPCCVFLGSTITDSTDGFIGTDGVPNGTSGNFDTLRTCTGDIEIIRQTENGTIESVKENVKSIIDGNGVWCYQIPMNLDRIGMDEDGNTVQITTPGKGIPTRARVRFRISLNTNDATTCKMLVPNNPKINHKDPDVHIPVNMQTEEEWDKWYEFGKDTPECCFRDLYWNKVYSVKQYYPRIQSGPIDPIPTGPGYEGEIYHAKNDYYKNAQPDLMQFPLNYSNPFNCIYSIYPSNFVNCFPYNTMYAGAEHRAVDQDNDDVNLWFKRYLTAESRSTLKEKGLHFCFENDWVNGCLYFPNVSVLKMGNGIKCFDESNGTTYITGRHELRYDNGKYEAHAEGDNAYCSKWEQTEEGDMNAIIRKNIGGEGINANYLFLKDGVPFSEQGKTYELRDLIGATYYPNGHKSGEGIVMYNSITAYICLNNAGYYAGENNISIDKTSHFSQIKLNGGVVKVFKNDYHTILYYNCGSGRGSGFQRLYATDIINLGNLYDVLDNLPHLYEKLPDTSFTIPPMAPNFKLDEAGMNMNGTRLVTEKQWGDNVDDDDVDIFGNTRDLIDSEVTPEKKKNQLIEKIVNKYDEAFLGSCMESSESALTPSTFLTILEYAQERYTLFFGQRSRKSCNYLHYLPTTFVNTSRICELGVENDHKTLGREWNINYVISGGTGENGQEGRTYPVSEYPINGMIDRFDIVDSQVRSEFASLNYDIEKSTYNPTDKRKCFVPTPMYMVDFDGRLKDYVTKRKFKHVDENEDKAYIKFRYGDIGYGPIKYEKEDFEPEQEPFVNYGYTSKENIFANAMNEDLILTENSFYFFFGLNYGYSALNKLRGKYCEWDNKTMSSSIIVDKEEVSALCHTLIIGWGHGSQLILDLYANGKDDRFKSGTRRYKLCKPDGSVVFSGMVEYSGSIESNKCGVENGYHITRQWRVEDINTYRDFYGQLLTFKIEYFIGGKSKFASYPFMFKHNMLRDDLFQ